MTRRAFTLFEILLAIGLTAALLVSMFTFLRDMTGARERASEHMRRQRTAQVLFERLERDLACCVVGDARDGAGLVGESNRLRLLTRAVPARLAERGALEPAVLADLEQCEYLFRRGGATIAMRRRVIGFAGAPEEAMVDIGHAGLVQFRFHDGSAWVDRFDSMVAEGLPRAVEVAIWFDPPDEEPAEAPDEAAEDAWLDEGSETPDPTSPDAPEDGAERDRQPSEVRDRRLPDRLRLIIIPDGGAGSDDAGSDDAGSGDGGSA